MRQIADLIKKNSIQIDADEDLEFKLKVTANWEAIVDSVKYY